MSDQKPRPQFGEYATSEEQRARISAPVDSHEGMPVDAESSTASQRKRSDFSNATTSGRPRLWDRILSFGILGIGLYMMLNQAIAYTNLAQYLSSSLADTAQVFGTGQAPVVANSATLTTIGLILGFMNVLLWAVALWWSIRSLRQAKITFWKPILVGVATNVSSAIVIAFVLMTAPGVQEYLVTVAG